MRIFYFILMFMLVGCTSPKTPKQPSAWLKPGVSVNLPAPALNQAFTEQQLLTANVNGKAYSLVALLDVNNERLNLAGLSSLGVRLFLLNYDDKGIHTEQSIMLPELPPAEQVLADIMLSYWPVESWAPNLPKGWTLVDLDATRELRDEKKQLVSVITYQLEANERVPMKIDNHVFGYQIMISRLGTPL